MSAFRMLSRAARGFTLIELMVAMVLGLLVAAGIVTVFASTSSSNKAQNQLAQLQEAGRFAVTRMGTDLRMANGQYCTNTGGVAKVASGGNALDHILYYLEGYDEFSDDGETLNGAYGRRLFSEARLRGESDASDEWQRVIDTLRKRPGSRNAVIQIYSNQDGAKDSSDIPCTCTLHFVIRKGRLHLHVHMRSNDAYKGMPHDVFSFSMLQEIAARELGLEVGTYQHSAASLHLYDDNEDFDAHTKAQQYLDEGLHDVVPMPPMPPGDPWPSIRLVLQAEREIRHGNVEFETSAELDPYWQDLITLLRVYGAGKHRKGPSAEELVERLAHEGFKLYVLDRIAKRRPPTPPVIEDMFKTDVIDEQGNS